MHDFSLIKSLQYFYVSYVFCIRIFIYICKYVPVLKYLSYNKQYNKIQSLKTNFYQISKLTFLYLFQQVK